MSSTTSISPLSTSSEPLSSLSSLDGSAASRGDAVRSTASNSGLGRSRRRFFAQFAAMDAYTSTSSLSTTLPDPPSASPADHLSLFSPAGQAQEAGHFKPDRPYQPGQPKSLAGIALRAFSLGLALGLAILLTLATLLWTASPLWRLPFFLAALAAFHFLEFWTTAAYNTRNADVKSFLLTANWPAYAIAHAAASLECLVVGVLWPHRSWAPLHSGTVIMVAGLAMVGVGQVVRSVAMVQAGASFNHVVQQYRTQQHILVTSGIYAHLRHPSYFGFFWWGLGTQLVMGNAICFVAYAAVLWRFFSSRIRREEQLLVQFFGDEYVEYRKKTGTKIPFVP